MFLEWVGAIATGGLLFKGVEWASPLLKDWWSSRRSAREILNRHLDPLLKAGDEFVGKLRHLAKGDFKEVIGLDVSAEAGLDDLMVVLSNCYLVAQFWAQMQVLRKEGLYANLARNTKGKQLLEFIYALEAMQIQKIGRARQRGIGDCILDERDHRPISYYQFFELYCRDSRVRMWFEPLAEAFSKAQHTGVRQQMLVYGAVVHAMLDTLDRKHLVIRDKPGWPNKLTKRSRRKLRYETFGRYLTAVERSEKYCGPS